LVERWGAGPFRGEPLKPDGFFLTVHNPTNRTRQGTLSLDARLGDGRSYLVLDRLAGGRIASDAAGGVSVSLRPMETALLHFVAQDPAGTRKALADAETELAWLAGKWRRHGMIDDAAAGELGRLAEE